MLATTPLSRQAILGARALAALAMVGIQLVLLAGTALALGWRPSLAALTLIPVAILGTLAFAALGFALGGAVRAEATLAIANAVFLLLVVVGGTTFPATDLPGPIATIVAFLPSSALGDLLRWGAGVTGAAAGSLVVDAVLVAVWGIAGLIIAVRTFRWS